MTSTQITLKKQILNVDSPNYYVTLNEGAFFDVCKTQEKKLSSVVTDGLSGCVALAIYIKDELDNSYLFLNHIVSDLPVNKVNSVIEKVKKTIKNYLIDFDYDDSIFEISVFVIGNQFDDLRTVEKQKRRNTEDIAHKIVENLSERMKIVNRPCYFAKATSVAFLIEGKKVKLIEPDWKNTKGLLTYYGKKHGGYGKPTNSNQEPYKNTCIQLELEY